MMILCLSCKEILWGNCLVHFVSMGYVVAFWTSFKNVYLKISYILRTFVWLDFSDSWSINSHMEVSFLVFGVFFWEITRMFANMFTLLYTLTKNMYSFCHIIANIYLPFAFLVMAILKNELTGTPRTMYMKLSNCCNCTYKTEELSRIWLL